MINEFLFNGFFIFIQRVIAPSGTFSLLQENGDFLLQETGDKILIE
jgi:hypothetical protein